MNIWVGMGFPNPPAIILAAALTGLGRLQQRKVAVKIWKSGWLL